MDSLFIQMISHIIKDSKELCLSTSNSLILFQNSVLLWFDLFLYFLILKYFLIYFYV